MSEPTDSVLVHRDGTVATIVLNRPGARNAWDLAMGTLLAETIARVAADDSVRAVLLTGAGPGFSAGADLRAGFDLTPEGHWDLHTPLSELYNPLIRAVREMPKPVIAAVRGAAAGIGCSLALAADIVLASETAIFLLAFVNVGLTLDGGSSAFVTARAGAGRALEMAMLGEPVRAAQALEWGLANRVVADDELDESALALAQRLAGGPTAAYAATKRELNAWVYGTLAAQQALETDEQQRLAATRDFAEGVEAFTQKRAAQFAGS